MNRKHNSLYERLVANSEVPEDQNENGCWIWTGKTDSKRWPYGKINVRIDGKHVAYRAHRLMAEIVHGRPLHPDLETVGHRCQNRLCINPDHLLLFTREENSRESAVRNPRGISARA